MIPGVPASRPSRGFNMRSNRSTIRSTRNAPHSPLAVATTRVALIVIRHWLHPEDTRQVYHRECTIPQDDDRRGADFGDGGLRNASRFDYSL